MELTKQVIGKQGNVFGIEEIVLVSAKFADSVPFAVPLLEFNKMYEEYVDPKDSEIARLLKIIKDLEKDKLKTTKRHLSKEERGEIKKLVENDIDIIVIATDYDISTSSIYKWIKEENWNFNKKRS